MTERVVRTLSFKSDKGKFTQDAGTVVGNVLPDGSVEGTVYKFDPDKIHGGVAITVNATLVKQGEKLVNPATGQEFLETKKKTGYWNQSSRTFVKVWNEDGGGENDGGT